MPNLAVARPARAGARVWQGILFAGAIALAGAAACTPSIDAACSGPADCKAGEVCADGLCIRSALEDGGGDAGPGPDAGSDAGSMDGGSNDAGVSDAGASDGGLADAGPGDGGANDAGAGDGGSDAGSEDGGMGLRDGGSDAGSDGGVDAGPDAGSGHDAGVPDAGSDGGTDAGSDGGVPATGHSLQGASNGSGVPMRSARYQLEGGLGPLQMNARSNDHDINAAPGHSR